MQNEREIRKLLVEIGKRVWTRGMVAANDGNFSVRLSEGFFLTTPTGVSKGFMSPEMMVKVDSDGRSISKASAQIPSSEIKMHLEVYKLRPDVNAVVHAHPPFCTAFAVAGIPLDKCILPEAVVSLGAVSIAPFGLPSTDEIPKSIAPFVKKSDAVLLQNHGALTLGGDLLSAYYKMETLEHTAQITWNAIQLGYLNILPQKQVARLQELRSKYNITGKADSCLPAQDESETKEVIDAAVKNILKQNNT